MKGDEGFRKKSKAFLQSCNEVFVYKSIIPYFNEYISKMGASGDDWIARSFYAECQIYPQLSNSDEETILALADLTSLGYRMSSSKIDLDENHLKIMARKIATYHGVSFAMKIRKDPMLEKLAAGLIPFHFKSESQGDLEPYKYLCPLSFERLFNYVEKTPKYKNDVSFYTNLMLMKQKVVKDLLGIMEGFLTNDHDFAVLLHGDYYRNNVMFKYKNLDGNDVPTDLRMFDFQETRFASVAIDLSIFMYMHINENIKPLIWDEILELYHGTLIAFLSNILECETDDDKLEPYSFHNFLAHFEKFAFYGVAVSVLSIPWMASSEEETQKIADFFENDMHNPEFKALLQVCGGSNVSERITKNVKHASEKGYLKIFE